MAKLQETEGLLLRNPSADFAFPVSLRSLIIRSVRIGVVQKYP